MPIFGHDVSDYQKGIDVSRLAARFIIAKSCQGAGSEYGTSKASTYATHKANARKGGKLFGAYVYLGNGITPAANAALHASVEPDRTIPVMLDWEKGSGNVAFLRACVDAFQAAGYHVFLTYAPKWYLTGDGGGGSLAGLPPLCSSRYPDYVTRSVAAAYAARTSSAWEGYGGNTVAVLQFTSSGRDAAYPNVNLDCLAFNGTDAELAALFGAAGGSTGGGTPAPADQEDNPVQLEPGNKSTSISCKGAKELVISVAYDSLKIHQCVFFGAYGKAGDNNLLKEVAPSNGVVTDHYPWVVPVPAGALSCSLWWELVGPDHGASVQLVF
ncbi:lysozyme [Amycolatopsis sp. NPDC001319]|uniref:lysozyme n=1 Tax=unclassified Amycolatopsis TaxID=2618356 RepID=UPI0036954BE9